MSDEREIEQVRKREVHRLKVPLDSEAIEERRKISKVVLELAKRRDEKTFRELLIGTLGMNESGEEFQTALAEFWNVVRDSERRVREKP